LQGACPVADELLDALYDRRLLLVLDNVEQLLSLGSIACTNLSTQILAGAPGVQRRPATAAAPTSATERSG
jgi:hypothetical protein